jgi:hypothetical protein
MPAEQDMMQDMQDTMQAQQDLMQHMQNAQDKKIGNILEPNRSQIICYQCVQ